jgi:outer membrane protein assembly factor BamB
MMAAEEPAWTVFNGLGHDNISNETGLLKTWGTEGPKLLWKNSGIGNTEFPGYASVTVADGRIFTAGNVKVAQSDKTADSVVFALDEKTGKEIWRYNNGSGWTDNTKFPGERGTPTIDGDRLYAYSSVGILACLEAKTGKEIWKRNLREDYIAQLPEWAYAESVVIDGSNVIVWSGGVKVSVAALDKMTGKTVWTTPPTGEIGNYASMTAFDYKGIRFYVNMTQKGVLAVNAATGEKLFYHPHETKYDINANTPYYCGDGKLLVISGNASGAEMLQLNVTDNKVTVNVLWKEPKLDTLHGGFIVKDSYIYAAAHNYKRGIWLCVKLDDGKIVWENRGPSEGAVSYADGLLYLYSEKEGNVALVKPSPEKYQEVSRFTLPEEGAGMYWAHPVICGKKLFLRHAEFLYCYDIAER